MGAPCQWPGLGALDIEFGGGSCQAMALPGDSVHKKSLFPSTASLCFPWGIFLVTGCLMLQEGWQVSPPGKGSATCIAKLRAIMPLIQAAWHGLTVGRMSLPSAQSSFICLSGPSTPERRVGMQEGHVCHSPQLSTQTQLILRG